jgi:hypothetical protein
MRKLLLAITLSSLSLSAAASAQGLTRGTPDEQRACSRDAQRFCREVISQGDLAVLACFQQNRTRISASCNAVLRSHGQ